MKRRRYFKVKGMAALILTTVLFHVLLEISVPDGLTVHAARAEQEETDTKGTDISREAVSLEKEASDSKSIQKNGAAEDIKANSKETSADSTKVNSKETVSDDTKANSKGMSADSTKVNSKETAADGTKANSKETAADGTKASAKGTSADDTEEAENTQIGGEETKSEAALRSNAAAGEVEINKENFPDAGFREYLRTDSNMLKLHQDPNKFTAAEMALVTVLNMKNSSSTAESLAGIEHFENLTTLHCNGVYLKSIDVSKNVKLRYLECSQAWNLTSLNIRNCTELETLYCQQCKLADLDLSTNSKLEVLWCDGNELRTLRTENNPELRQLYCYQNQLTALDVGNNTKLKDLRCETNALEVLDVGNNRLLEILFCDRNQLKEIHIKGYSYLRGFSIDDNQLTSLDASDCPELGTLNCRNNQLKELKVTGDPKLRELICTNNQLTELDVRDNEALHHFHAGKNQLKALDVSNSKELSYFYFPENQLTEIDLSQNPQIVTFWCQNNQLKALDLRENTKLGNLDCSQNQLQTLDLSQNQSLRTLACTKNQLLSLQLPMSCNLKTPCEQHVVATTGEGQREWDLSESDPNVDRSKISNLQGASFSGSSGTVFTDFQPGTDVTYTYDCENSLTMQVTVHFKETNRWITELTGMSGWRYGDAPVSPRAESLYGEVQYLYSGTREGEDYHPEIPQESGIWYVKAVVPETEDYTGLEGTPVEFEITKAVPAELVLPDGLSAAHGSPLSTVVLPQGWAWVNPNENVHVEKQSYEAMWEVDDRNYDYTKTEGYDAEKHAVFRELNVTVVAEEKKRVDISQGIREIPDSLKDAGLDTETKITEKLCQVAAEKQGYSGENTVVYDVKLQVSLDGGKTWENVTPENFPGEGLEVLLPYPEETNRADHDFIVTHMFTHEMNGHEPGEVETLEAEKAEEGLRFTVYSLSPIAIAWKAHDTDSGSYNPEKPGTDSPSTDTGNQKPETNSPSTDTGNRKPENRNEKKEGAEVQKSDSPPTGDVGEPDQWIFWMLLAGIGGCVCFRKSK
ncbi:MAG: hypothetical protein HFH24_05790 [Ruminococcus sp.]|nr:hypothetical protein [Ruminococcus sp.]